MKWQPIETAPMGGTEVLITDGENYAVAIYVDEECGWRDMGDIGWAGMVDHHPTHWMPLPNPPADPAGRDTASQ